MKTILSTLVLTSFSLITFSQDNTFPTSGNVGIGTTSPEQRLDVRGAISSNISGNEIGGTIVIKNPAKVTTGTASSWQIYNMTGPYGNSLQFWSYDNLGCVSGGLCANRFTLMDNGNVGIGTTSTSAKLEINGDANIGSDAGTINGYGAKLQLLGASSNGDALWFSRFNNGANQTELRVNIGDDVGQAQDMFVVGTHSWNGGAWNPFFTVQASGNVGIGTTNPNQKLTVNGTIYGKEVKVDLSVPGPDYVFEENYNLPSLTETENYIKQNKHLPEVPSAKEMEANGINLAEMNMLLLKKVEELTLHLIVATKDIQKLQNKVEEQATDLRQLKQSIK